MAASPRREAFAVLSPTMQRLLIPTVGLLYICITSFARSIPPLGADPPRRPLVIWHGLGDSYGSPGMLEFMDLIKEMHPGLYIHSVYLDEDLEADQKAGFVRIV